MGPVWLSVEPGVAGGDNPAELIKRRKKRRSMVGGDFEFIRPDRGKTVPVYISRNVFECKEACCFS